MTEQECVDAIALMVPEPFQANAQAIAASYLKKAVLKVGRMRNVNWNQRAVNISLTSGTSSYKIGVDILATHGDLKKIQYLWRTDTQQPGIPLVDVQQFNHYARGSSRSGAPELATIHSDQLTFEVWPTPDSSYTLWSYIRMKIENFDQIPTEYYDVLIDVAVTSMRDPKAMAIDGLKEMREDSVLQWDGNTIPIARHVGKTYNVSDADSQNLRGD